MVAQATVHRRGFARATERLLSATVHQGRDPIDLSFVQAPPEQLECQMPCDFVFSRLLSMERPQTPEAFERAALVRSRLGKLLEQA